MYIFHIVFWPYRTPNRVLLKFTINSLNLRFLYLRFQHCYRSFFVWKPAICGYSFLILLLVVLSSSSNILVSFFFIKYFDFLKLLEMSFSFYMFTNMMTLSVYFPSIYFLFWITDVTKGQPFIFTLISLPCLIFTVPYSEPSSFKTNLFVCLFVF